MTKLSVLAAMLLALTACTSGTSNNPINFCILAQCEQQADTGDGDLDEGSQDAQVEAGL
jgi:hypothetical protein